MWQSLRRPTFSPLKCISLRAAPGMMRSHVVHLEPAFHPVLILRRDRYLRGGDHTSFNGEGFAAIRFTEWRENFDHQHQKLRTENGIEYGDLLKFVDFNYVTNVARINAVTLATLAIGPECATECEGADAVSRQQHRTDVGAVGVCASGYDVRGGVARLRDDVVEPCAQCGSGDDAEAGCVQGQRAVWCAGSGCRRPSVTGCASGAGQRVTAHGLTTKIGLYGLRSNTSMPLMLPPFRGVTRRIILIGIVCFFAILLFELIAPKVLESASGYLILYPALALRHPCRC